jgi:hypothetical protein
MDYPENCLRGISAGNDKIDAFGKPNAVVFHFDRNPSREGIWELSINWQDDEKAITFTLSQLRPKDNICKFANGLVVVPKQKIDELIRVYETLGLKYERNQFKDNKYHGNLLLNGEVNPLEMKKLAAAIALIPSNKIIPQP